jgi:hypothetical protein
LGLLGGVLALAGCGSGGTQTVSVSNGGPASTSATAPRTTGVRPPAASATSRGRSAANGQKTGGAPSRTAPRPAFAQPAGGGEGQAGLQAALATVRAHGFTASDASQYHPDQTLRVLVGTHGGSGEGRGQQAFFFVNGRYIGTDAREPSASVRVVSQSDTEVVLAYSLYRPRDSACCPGGGQAKIRFQLDNGRLVALDPIPPVSSTSGLSRQ